MSAPRTIAALLLALAAPVAAQVDCGNPDNLCTGDPCVIPDLEPASSCIVDFGARDLVIEGLLNVETVEFRANRISVTGPVSGRPGLGGRLALVATGGFTGGFTVDAPIWFDGESSIELTANETSAVNAPIRVTGDADAPIDSVLRIFVSAESPLEINAPIVNRGGADSVIIGATGRLSVNAPITNRRSGEGPQPPLALSGSVVRLDGAVTAGGSVGISAEGTIAIRKPIRAGGSHVAISTSEPVDGLVVDAPIKSTGRFNGSRCGAIRLHGGKGGPIINAPVVCAGRAGGEGISLEGDAVVVNDTVRTTSKDAAGGDIVLIANDIFSGFVSVTGQLLARGSQPGDVLVQGVDISFEDAVVKTSARSAGGAQRYTASNDLLLRGTFIAPKRGTIEAAAAGNLTVDGSFSVGTGGCIGLSAGGTLTTGSSTFDQSTVQTCP